jgi:aminoglycoside 2''-phosphotransferase
MSAPPGDAERTALQHALEATLGESHVTPIAEGFSSHVFRTGNGTIVRVARTMDAARKHDLMLSVLPRLAPQLPIAIPVPVSILPPSAHLPFGALTYPALPGTAATSADTSPAIAGQLASFLATLHHIDVSSLGDVPRQINDDGRWQELRARIQPTCRRVFSPAENQRLSMWWDRFFRAPERHRFVPSLAHGDLWYENLLLDDTGSRVTAILDWESLNIGDPAQDLARLRYAGSAFAEDVHNRYVALCDRADPLLAIRTQWFWEAGEFHGLRWSIDQHDAAELDDAVAKIRRGPILGDQQDNA